MHRTERILGWLDEWRPWLLLLIASVLILGLIGITNSRVAVLLGVLLAALVLAAVALRHYSFTVRALVFFNILLIVVPVYAIPLPGGFDLQLNRIPILLAVPLWLIPFFMPPYRRLKIRFSWSFVWYGLFTFYVLLSILTLSDNPRTAVSQFMALVFRGALFFWLPQVIRKRRDLVLAADALLAGGVILVGFAVYQYVAWFTGWNRVGASFVLPFAGLLGMHETLVEQAGRMGPLFRLTLPFGTSSHLGPAVAVILLVAMGLWFYHSKRKTWRALFLFIYCLVMFGLLLGTYSRGAWVGFVAGLLTMVLFQRRLLLKKRVWRTALVIAVVLGIAAIVFLPFAETVLWRFDQELTEATNEGHIRFFLRASELAAESPILGIGWANFEARTGALHAHNVYMNILAEAGFIGLFLWLLLSGSLLLIGAKAVLASPQESFLRFWNLGLLAALVSILVDNLFQSSFLGGFVWAIAGLVVASYYVTVQEARTERVGALELPG